MIADIHQNIFIFMKDEYHSDFIWDPKTPSVFTFQLMSPQSLMKWIFAKNDFFDSK